MPIDKSDESQILYIREFLNNEGSNGLAAILADINAGDQDEDYLDFGATLQIADCNRTVTLDFGVFGQADTQKERDTLRKDLQNSRDKAQRLLAAVQRFVANANEGLLAVEEELDARDTAAREKKTRKAAKKAQQEG